MSAPKPRATLAPQTRHPRPTPNAAATPRLAPSIAAVRNTSAVSIPGVTVTIAAAARKAMSDWTRVMALRLACADMLLQPAMVDADTRPGIQGSIANAIPEQVSALSRFR